MKLTREEALKLHREMWSDMQTALAGGNDNNRIRSEFKERWVKSHFPEMEVKHYCFLCEYALQMHNEKSDRPLAFFEGKKCCKYCPIDWRDDIYRGWSDNSYKGNGYDCENGEVSWECSPISEILALPERIVNENI